MRLLITGGAGFLGSNLAAESLYRSDTLVIFDNLSRHGAAENIKWLSSLGTFRHVHGDIRNSNDISRIIQEFEPEVIFHLAGQVTMTRSIADPRNDFETNVLGTHNLLEAVRNCVPEAIVIYSSTNKVYGDLEQFRYLEDDFRYQCFEKPNGFDENTQLEFHSPYGCSKGAADQMMLDYARIFGIRTVVFRHSSMYGGRQFATYDQGWIGWFCQKAVESVNGILKEPFTISGNGKQVRDVLHAGDMTRLYSLAINNIERARGNAFNIGGGRKNSLSLLELFSLLERINNIHLSYITLPPRLSDQKVFIADTEKAKRLLEWEPQIDFETGIASMLEWVVQCNGRES